MQAPAGAQRTMRHPGSAHAAQHVLRAAGSLHAPVRPSGRQLQRALARRLPVQCIATTGPTARTAVVDVPRTSVQPLPSTSAPPPPRMSVKEMSAQMREMRKSMAEDSQLNILMAGLRGSNMDSSDFADSNVVMRLVEVSDKDGSGEGLPLVYDHQAIARYWGRRPMSVATRITQLLGIAGGFLSKLGWDVYTKRLAQNEVKRAIELRNIVTSLGPAYIKLGQALSIRPDILSPAAMNELQKLCDKVPSFDTKIAMKVIEDELGAPWYEVYADLSPEPIAAASLGQVYKGRLKTGEAVAVKVQRPFVVETVSIDLFIIRKLGAWLRRFPQISTDVVALLDEWAARFFEELDYIREGQNGIKFAQTMARDLPQVVVPQTYTELTSRRVLTTGWLDGEKLSQSTADDVGQLVNVGVVCYLKQLLDTGFFHADPHPGNLIRTPDGRLAILDYGLMTQVDDNIKYGMIEAISHLIHRDYEAIVEDFVTLDFIPPGTDLKPILPILAKVFDQALEGGGAKNINFQELAADLAQVTFDYPFRIPPYFALIIRAIGVLEGIALVGNPDFALVDEAYPYVAKRLLTDPSPRLRAALRYMVYGKEKTFDADRLLDLLSAFETFSVASRSATGDPLALPSGDARRPPAALPPAQQQRWLPATAASSTMPEASTSGRPAATWPPLVPFPLPGSALLPSILFPPPALVPFPLRAFLPPVAPAGGTRMALRDAGAAGGGPGGAREALNFIFSPEGAFFREFFLEEIVKGIDALSREQARAVVEALGLGRARFPVLVPGAVRGSLPLAPPLSPEDRRVVDNVVKVTTFLAGGRLGEGAATPATWLADIAPYAPALATEVLPQLAQRLLSRMAARTLRDLYMA